MAAGHGILALMGSGETSPTMVTLHRELAGRLGAAADAVILETPYAFQVNREDISSRARDYFRRSVGLATVIAPDTGAGEETGELLRDQVRRADWVFSGPGSPSYALERWRARKLGEVLADRVRRGHGVTVMASAAACTAGFAAVPVYEVYKAGHAPVWLEGLDLFGALGVPVAVVPHYDNAEGRTHDTRFCYLGEERLALMERELPQGSAVLGIDEHTAVIVDLDTSEARVWGRGVMTVRRQGVSVVVPAGSVLSVDELRDLARGRRVDRAQGPLAGAVPAAAPVPSAADSGADAPGEQGPATLQEAVDAWESRFDGARAARDAGGMLDAVLGLEAVVAAWGSDTEEDQGSEWARTVLRGMVRGLAGPLESGLTEPESTLGRLLAPLLDLRGRLRAAGSFALADEVRTALVAGGIEIRDTATGGQWSRREGNAPEGGE